MKERKERLPYRIPAKLLSRQLLLLFPPVDFVPLHIVMRSVILYSVFCISFTSTIWLYTFTIHVFQPNS